MNSNLPNFRMVMTSDDTDVKRSVAEVREEIADVKQEAASAAPELERHAAALTKEAEAAERAAKANRDLASAEKAARDQVNQANGVSRPSVPAQPTVRPQPSQPQPQPAPPQRPQTPPSQPPAQPPQQPANDNADRFRRQVLGYQLFDTVGGLSSGQPIRQVIAQQGPQILQMYAGQGGVNAAMKDFGTIASGVTRLFTPLTIGIGSVTAALALGATAWSDYLASTKEVEAAAQGLGQATAGSFDDMEAAAKAGAASANISVSAARSMEAQFLRTGRIGSENFEQLIGISKDFGATIGMNATDASAALAEMFADPAKAAQTLYQQYGLIDAATAKQATNLAQQNRQSEAQAVLLDALPKRLTDASTATTALGRAWDAVGRGASSAMDAIGGAIDRAVSGPTRLERIASINQQLASYAPRPGQRGRAQNTDALTAERDRLQAEQDAEDRAVAQRKQEAENTARSRAVITVAEGSGVNAGALQRQQLRNEVATLQSGQGLTGLDAEQTKMVNEALEAKTRVLDALSNKQQRQTELDRLDIQIQTERNPIIQADLEARRTRLQLADQEISSAQIEAQAEAARNRVIETTIATSASQARDMQQEYDLRSQLNGLVASGSITSADANRMLQEELTLRPLITAAATAEGDTKTRLLQVITDLRTGYANLAAQEKEASGQEYLRSQNEKIEQLRLEQSLIGQNETVRARAQAGLQSEQKIRTMGISSTSTMAEQIRKTDQAVADLNRTIEKQSDAWKKVQDTAGNTIDNLVDGLAGGDMDSALESIKKDITGTFLELGVKNPIKNALLGTDQPTVNDAGGVGGIFTRLLGGGKTDPASLVSNAMNHSVASMAVSAGTVVVNGGIGGGIGGAGTTTGLLGNTNDNAANPTSATGVGGQIWNYFAGKGLKPYQIAGIMGNVSAESAYNPGAVGDNGNALGLFQWNDRAPSMLSAIGGRQNLGNVQSQLDFAWKEMQGSESGAYQRLLASTDVKSATAAFAGFERPSGWSAENPEASMNFLGRLNGANDALAKFGSTTGTAAQGLGTLGTGFDSFGSALSNLQLGGSGSGGGFFSSLLSGIGSLFGGSGVSPTSSSWSANTTLSAVLGLADGGHITGPGGPRDDIIPVWASNGEFMVNAEATAKHRPFLEAINSNRPILSRASGGSIGSIGSVYARSSDAVAGGAAGATSGNQRNAPIINNYGSNNVSYEEQTDQHGNRQPIVTIGETTASAIKQRGNPTRRALQSEFGLKPARVKR